MKVNKTLFSILLAVFTLSAFLSLNAVAVKAGITKGVYAVSDYTGFYKVIQSSIKAKQTSVTINAKYYSSSKYNLNKAIDQTIGNNPAISNYVKSAHMSIKAPSSKSSSRTLNIQIGYTNTAGYAKDYNSLYSIMNKAVQTKKGSVNIVVSSTQKDIINRQFSIKDDINSKLSMGNQIDELTLRYDKFPGTNLAVLKYGITYKSKYNSGSSTSAQSVSSSSDLFNAIKAAAENCNGVVNIGLKGSMAKNSFNTLTSMVDSTIYKVSDDMYGQDYITNWNVNTNSSGSSLKIKIFYAYSKAAILQRRSQLDKKTDQVMGTLVKPGMSDYSIELAVHNYIVKNTRYDEENDIQGTLPEDSYSAYGILVKGVGVCEGYANTMDLMLGISGIESIPVSGIAYDGGQAIDHEWNLVKLNGKYYHVDTTWDDPIYEIDGKKTDVLTYDYFNITDKQMSKDHKWNTSQYPKTAAANFSNKS